MRIVYLSPHFDDVALSCGGLIWEQVGQGHQVEIWTLCAGDMPPGPYSAFVDQLHARWQAPGDAVAMRQAEDIASCKVIGARWRHLAVPDCIYRRPLILSGSGPDRPAFSAEGPFLYPDRVAIFGAPHPDENALAGWVAAELHRALVDQGPQDVRLVTPLSIGGHVDHQLARQAAERLELPLWYYPDYPYAGEPGAEIQVSQLVPGDYLLERTPLSPAARLAWGRAIAAHQSQISTFWESLDQMQAEIDAYHDHHGGIRLWRPLIIQD